MSAAISATTHDHDAGDPIAPAATRADAAREIRRHVSESERLLEGDAKAAVAEARAALDLARPLGDEELMLEGEYALGSALATAGDPVSAATYLTAATQHVHLRTLRRAEAMRQLANVQGNLLGRPKHALETLDGALSIATAIGAAELEARIIASQGTLLGRLGQADDARRALERAYELLRGLGAHRYRVNVLANLSYSHVVGKTYERALALTDEAIALGDPIVSHTDLLAVRGNRAIALAGLGRRDEALAQIVALRAGFGPDDDQHTKLSIFIDHGQVLRLQGDLAGAQRVLQEGWREIEAAGLPMLEVECLVQLAATSEDLGDYRAALDAHKTLARTRQRMFDDETSQKVAALESGLRFEQKQRENALLRSAQAELEARVAERTTQLSAANEELAREIRARAQVQARLEALNNAYPIGMFRLDAGGRIAYVNATFAPIAGIGDGEATGREWTSSLHPAERADTAREWRDTVARGETYAGEHRFLHPGGEQRWAKVKIARIDGGAGFDGYVGALEDVTATHIAVESLRASEERFRDLVELSSDWYWEQDAELRFTYLSRTLRSNVDYDPYAILGKRRWETGIEGVSEAEWQAHRALLERRAPFHDFVFRRRTRDGDLGWYSISGKPVFSSEGRFQGYRGTGRDITRSKELEIQVRQKQKIEAIGQLAGGIAHDFNNIIAAIAGNARLARGTIAPDHPVVEYVEGIETAVERAAALVRQILTFSRGQGTERLPVDVGATVGDAVKFLRTTLPAMIEIQLSVAPGTHTVASSTIAVHQLVINLGTNASHALSGRGLLEFGVRSLQVDDEMAAHVPGLEVGAWVCLTVRDNGVGMSPETLEHIFEPFFSTKTAGKGTGLGLSVVHGIVREHGGTLGVASAPGRGTTIDVYLPRIAAVAAPPVRPATGQASGRGERVLFVDDDEALVFLAQRMLQQLGYRVTSFQSSDEALAAFTADPQGFDVLVTDLAMPRMSGLDLAERVLAKRPGLPIVVLSGYVRDADTRRAQELGIGEIHLKPSTIEVFTRFLHERLSGRLL